MIVLDASVLIAYLDGGDAHHTAALSLLETSVDDEIAASVLTLAEVLVAPSPDDRVAATRSALAEIGLVEIPFPVDAAARLARLRWGTGLRLPDCCVLLAAQGTQAAVASFDERLLQAAHDLGHPVLGREAR